MPHIFSREQVMKFQRCGADGVDEGVWNDNLYARYELKVIPINFPAAKHHGAALTYTHWLNYQSQIIVNDKPWLDLEGLATIVKLMIRIRDNKRINPIVITKDGQIVDGLHRVVAFASMGFTSIQAFVPAE